jgi:hypothetical protein
MTFLEELLNSLKKPQGSPAMATPPFLPPGQAPAPQPSFDFAGSPFPSAPAPQPQMPQLSEVTVPDRQLSAGVLQEVSAPDRERVSGMIDQPWYKDKDTMEDLGARLSQAFGGLTMRGNSAAETAANMKRMQGAAANKQKNKTMDYLIKNNPEMAKVLMGVPEEYRGQTLEKLYGLQTGGSDPASVKEWKFRESLTPEQRAEFDRTQAKGSLVTGPDGSVGYYDNAGTFTSIISPDQALQMTAAGADAEKGGVAHGEDFRTMYKASRYTQDNLDGLMQTRQRLENSKDGGGIFQPYKQTFDRIAARFGNIDAAARATNEELLEIEGIERTMQWFLSAGLGARGLDTPAEFMQWLKLNGGDLSMSRDASIAFIDKAIENTMRSADRYNEARTDPLYSDVHNIGNYPQVEYTDPRAQSQTQNTPQFQVGQIVDGREYIGGDPNDIKSWRSVTR